MRTVNGFLLDKRKEKHATIDLHMVSLAQGAPTSAELLGSNVPSGKGKLVVGGQ